MMIRKTCKSPTHQECSQGQVRKRVAGGYRMHVQVPRKISIGILQRAHLHTLTHQEAVQRCFWKPIQDLQTSRDVWSWPQFLSHSRISLPSLSSSSSYTGKKVYWEISQRTNCLHLMKMATGFQFFCWNTLIFISWGITCPEPLL